jgi:hypothetical protein
MNNGALLVASVKSRAGIATIFFATVLKREIQPPTMLKCPTLMLQPAIPRFMLNFRCPFNIANNGNKQVRPPMGKIPEYPLHIGINAR